MATIPMTIETVDGTRIMRATWSGIGNGDNGQTMDYPEWADRNIQVFGTFGVGGALSFEGSNDQSNWVTLHDATGSTISFSTAGVKMILENVLYVRPVVVGDGTTSLTAIMVARRTN